MKKRVMILVVAMIMAPTLAFSQARVTNAGSQKVEFSSPDGLRSTTILPGGTTFISWLPQNGDAKYKLSRYDGDRKIDLGQLTGQASDGQLTVNGSVDNQSKAVYSGTMVSAKNSDKTGIAGRTTTEKTTANVATKTVVTDSNVAVWATTSVVLSNASDYRLTVLGPPFQGAALKSGQTSKKVVTLSTGEYVIAVYFDNEQDSVSTGREYGYSVVDKIIVEGQDTFFIRNDDLKKTATGAVIKRSLRNNLAIDFLIMSGPNRGKVIAAKMASDKLILNVGWNVIPVQYKDENGLPVQAVLLLLASDYGRLSADAKSGKELSIERNNIIFTTR